MAASFADVPDRYDVVVQLNDGSTYGFLLADSVESNLPFRTHKALYSYSPTFLERQNVSNQYGDNFQDFFLTGSQNDFSLGEGQKYFRVNDIDRSRRYWQGKDIEPVDVPGNVSLTYKTVTLGTTAGIVMPTCAAATIQNNGFDWWAADNTNLYGIVASSASATSSGAHAAGTVQSIAADPSNVYIAGTTAIRKYHLTGGTFSTFSASVNVTQMVYLNNILYGYKYDSDSLLSFDTVGNATTQFQWKNADGTTVAVAASVLMVPYGGSIYIMRNVNQYTEIWKYDGSGCLLQAQLPPDFVGGDLAVASGIIFISGYFKYGSTYRPAVFYYVNGSVGQLWKSPTTGGSTNVPIDAFGNGVAFKDPVTGNVYQYDISLGGVHCIANYNDANPDTASMLVSSSIHSAFILVYSDNLVAYGGSSNYNSTGFIQTSLYDFDNTLSKIFRGLKIDADIPANTSVDLAYQIDGLSGAYTNLQTGATSGTEYLLPANTTGHAISVQVTLNSASGSATPTIKRVYIRAAPTLQQFRRREFLFDLSGGVRSDLGRSSRRDRDGFAYPYDPQTAAKNLIKIATQTIPFTIQDRFDQFTCLADLQQNQAGYDGFALYDVRPNVLIGRLNVREV